MLAMFSALKKKLMLNEAEDYEALNDFEKTKIHQLILEKKRFLRSLYTDFYQILQDRLALPPEARIVEIGSGGGFLKEMNPLIITSDVQPVAPIDICFSAQAIPFRTQSLDGIVMLNVFHHIKDPVRFLEEMTRCLKKGGRAVFIEPANTPWSRFIYKNFHHEPFDPQAGWSIDGKEPLSSANSALPWIVFQRDRDKLSEKLPQLICKTVTCHTPFRYLISGGFSFKQLLPSGSYAFVKICEILLSVFNPWLGMFMTIELKKF